MTALEQQIQDQTTAIDKLRESLSQQLHRRGIIVASADPERKDEQIAIVDSSIDDLRNQIGYQEELLKNLQSILPKPC